MDRRKLLATLAGGALATRAFAAQAATAVARRDPPRYMPPPASDAAMAGQLLLLHLRYLPGGAPQRVLGDATRQMLADIQPGGVVLYAANIAAAAQLRALVADIRGVLRIAPFIAIDEEGGRVSRIRGLDGMALIPPALELAREGIPAVERAYATIGDELAALGINMDLAPVADLGFHPETQFLGDRAFAADPAIVSAAVTAAVDALQARAVMAVVKHFPGHGRTRRNSHVVGSVINASRAELEMDLQPFRAAFAAGASGMMTAHVAYPALDPSGLPASLSKRILQDVARTELGFDGLIVTDAIEMRGLTAEIRSEEDAALTAFRAGADLLMGPTDPRQVRDAILGALAPADSRAREARQRLVESYRRIMGAKARHRILVAAK
ncbi:MAG: glycoside hydrolase family 3 N-terminal domain-containing protein [Betaproteobacteria bacterium]